MWFFRRVVCSLSFLLCACFFLALLTICVLNASCYDLMAPCEESFWISRNVLLASVTSIRNHQQFNDWNKKKTSKHFFVVIAYRVNRVQLARLNLFVSDFFFHLSSNQRKSKHNKKIITPTCLLWKPEWNSKSVKLIEI